MNAIIDQTAPEPVIERWVQGHEPPLSELTGEVILIEVIQVNCPGCFVHALPECIRLHQRYTADGLKVFAIATAFEHFENNTLNNLKRLLRYGELQGEPLTQLEKAGFLDDGRLPYEIPFSVAMDRLVKNEEPVTEQMIDSFILGQIPDFHTGSLSDERRTQIYRQAESYLGSKTWNALTFEMYSLQGTPSSILIDRGGTLRQVAFGSVNHLEPAIQRLLDAG